MWARVVKCLVSTSLLLSLDGALIYIFASYLYETQINPQLIVASFLGVFSVYNLNKATDRAEDQMNQRETTANSNIYYIIPSVLAMAVSLIIADLNSVFALLILTIPLVVGLFYSVKISNRLPRLKEVTGAKSILVALSWSVTGSLLPLSMQAVDLQRVGLVFSYIFIQVLVNTVLFDVLDTTGDLVTGIKTIPALLGLSQTRVFLMLANSTLIFWIAFCFADGLFLRFLPALFFGVMYGYGIICYFMRKNSRKISTDIFIDGQWLLILPLMKII